MAASAAAGPGPGDGDANLTAAQQSWVRAVATPDGVIDADLVVLGTGVRPASDLAAASGVPVGPSRGIVTDARMRTPVDGVWAAGDCAETRHRVTGRYNLA